MGSLVSELDRRFRARLLLDDSLSSDAPPASGDKISTDEVDGLFRVCFEAFISTAACSRWELFTSNVCGSTSAGAYETTLEAGVSDAERDISSGEGDISNLGSGKLSRDLLLRLKLADHCRRCLLGGETTCSGVGLGVINLETTFISFSPFLGSDHLLILGPEQDDRKGDFGCPSFSLPWLFVWLLQDR